MVSHRAFATRRQAQGSAAISRARVLRLAAAFGLAVLIGGLTLPLVGLVLAHETAPFCCSKGRCCCADDAAARDDRTCLRRGCGCERPGDAVMAVPLQIEAVLPSCEPLGTALPAEARWEAAGRQPLPRADAPPVPPPRLSSPA
jgi:hypothetical protein